MRVISINGEPALNSNGRKLHFSVFNQLKVSNTFYKHKDTLLKYTSNERDLKTVIDYVLVNGKNTIVEDIRVNREVYISSDCFLTF